MKQPDIEALLARSSHSLRQQFRTLKTKAASGELSRKDATSAFRLWLDDALGDNGLPNTSPGRWIGAFWRDVDTYQKSSLPLTAIRNTRNDRRERERLIQLLPYPLGLKLGELYREYDKFEQGVGSSNFAFLIASLNGLLLRFLGVLVLCEYVEHHQAPDAGLNQRIIALLKRPSDGSWKQLIDGVLRWHATRSFGDALSSQAILSHAIASYIGGKQGRRSPTRGAILQQLVAFRNKLLHGTYRFSEADVVGFAGQMMNLYEGLSFMESWDWWLVGADHAASFRGDEISLTTNIPPAVVTDIAANAGIIVPIVSMPSQERALSLHPLLVYSAGAGDDLFFFNAWNDAQISFISYRLARHLSSRQLGMAFSDFQGFVRRIPAAGRPEAARFDFSGVADFHRPFFVGRKDAISQIFSFLHGSSQMPYGAIFAVAGMGKTALLASLYSRFRAGRDWPDEVWPLWHFCSTSGGRHHPAFFLRSILSQFDELLGKDDRGDYPTSIDLLRQMLQDCLEEVRMRTESDDGKPLPKGVRRVVLIVDALDEALVSTQGSLSIPALLPTVDELPACMSVLISYRVDESGSHEQVEYSLPVAAQQVHHIEGCSPLGGLTREDVSAVLVRVSPSEGVSPQTEDAIWETASQEHVGSPRGSVIDEATESLRESGHIPALVVSGPGQAQPAVSRTLADPFVLRFLVDGVKEGTIDPQRAESVPSSLHALFEQLWNRLPTDHHFFLHRLLGMLAIMPGSGADALFAEVFSLMAEQDDEVDSLFPDDVAARRQAINKLLVFSGDRYRLFHQRFQRYVVQRFRPKEHALSLHRPLYLFCVSEQGRGSLYDLQHRLFHLRALACHEGLDASTQEEFRSALWEALWDDDYFDDKFQHLNRVDALIADFVASFDAFHPARSEVAPAGVWQQVARSFHLCQRTHSVVSQALEHSQQKVKSYAAAGDVEKILRLAQWEGADYRRVLRVVLSAVWMVEQGKDPTSLLSYLGTLSTPSLRREEVQFVERMLRRAGAPERVMGVVEGWGVGV